MQLGYGVSILERGRAHGQLDGLARYTASLQTALIEIGEVDLTEVSFRNDRHLPAFAAAGALTRRFVLSATAGVDFPEAARLRSRVQLFHAPDHVIPRLRGIPVVATVMDDIALAHPEWAWLRFGRTKRWLFRESLQWADQIVTISAYSRARIAARLGMSPQRIEVVPLGVDRAFFSPVEEPLRRSALASMGIRRRFFLFVGTLQPRKNIERLLAAHVALPAAIRSTHSLVIAGRAGWGVEALIPRIDALERDGEVLWLRTVSDDDLRCLMQSACALVFPSLAEGFGLPVLEAFASGLPVVTSNVTALPEVAGGAAVLVDPLDVAAISAAMARIATDRSFASELSALGRRRAQTMTWEACARATIEVYRRLV